MSKYNETCINMLLNGTEKQSMTTGDRIEHLHHLNMANDLDALAGVLKSHGQDLVKGGHTELLGILRAIDDDGLDPDTQSMVRAIR